MSKFTYELNKTDCPLETFEWDNFWLEHTENTTAKRIFYIGDSISCGIRHHITSVSNQSVLCSGFGTSKAVDNPFYEQSLETAFMQHTCCDMILFNNGLHGGHLSDEEYGLHYEKLLVYLKNKNIPMFLVLTTDVTDSKCSETVKRRNKVVKELAEKYSLPVIDLFSFSVENVTLHLDDGVHFVEAGYEKAAEFILKEIDLFH